MNKKGFTLVEILAVIVLLGIVITLVATKGFGAFDNAKTAISKENEKVIIEGAKVFLVELDYCEDGSDLDDLLKENSSSCQDINETKEICYKLGENACDATFNFDEYSTITSCEKLICDNSQKYISLKLEDLISNNYVTGSGVETIEKEYQEKNGTEMIIDVYLNGKIVIEEE